MEFSFIATVSVVWLNSVLFKVYFIIITIGKKTRKTTE